MGAAKATGTHAIARCRTHKREQAGNVGRISFFDVRPHCLIRIQWISPKRPRTPSQRCYSMACHQRRVHLWISVFRLRRSSGRASPISQVQKQMGRDTDAIVSILLSGVSEIGTPRRLYGRGRSPVGAEYMASFANRDDQMAGRSPLSLSLALSTCSALVASIPVERAKAPVFVVGSPRSGTTLLYHTILSSGNFVVYQAESDVFNRLAPAFGNLGSQTNRGCTARRVVAEATISSEPA